MEFVFQIAILIMSVVIHEVSHGYAASALGDETARYQGRLTLNPLSHLDPMGSFIIPFLTYSFGGFTYFFAYVFTLISNAFSFVRLRRF